MTDSAMPVVPPELSDYIIDYLYDDSSVVLHNPKLCTLLARLLSFSPHLASYVRILNISKLDSSKSQEAITQDAHRSSSFTITRLIRLRTLGVSVLSLNPALLHALVQCPSIKELQLQYCDFAAFDDFVQLYGSFPHLEVLFLRGVSWTSTFMEPRETAVKLELQKLILGKDVDLGTVAGFLLEAPRHEATSNFSVTCVSEADVASAGWFIQNLAPSLEVLNFEWYPCDRGIKAFFLPASLSIEDCKNLKTVSLHCVITPGCTIPWVPALLSQCNAGSIKEIALEIRLLGDLDALDWEALQKALSSTTFKGLEHVTLKVALWSGVPMSQTEVRDAIRERLACLDKKRLLRFAN